MKNRIDSPTRGLFLRPLVTSFLSPIIVIKDNNFNFVGKVGKVAKVGKDIIVAEDINDAVS